MNLSAKQNRVLIYKFDGLFRSESIFHLPHRLVARQWWGAIADAPILVMFLARAVLSQYFFSIVLVELVPQHLLFYFVNLLVTLKTGSTNFQNLASEQFY